MVRRAQPWIAATSAVAAVLFLATGARAASFGVPTGNPPSGYFILTGPDLGPQPGNNSWGDPAHQLDLFIEVAGGYLRVQLYDPGLAPSALDMSFSGTPGQVTYTLFDGSGGTLAQQVFQTDTMGAAGTDQALVTLYDGTTAPGTHRLLVTMDDTAGVDDDVNAFGVYVLTYDFYSYNFVGGETGAAGGVTTDPLVLYPWVVGTTAATFGTPPMDIVGIDVLTFDHDSAGPSAPPSLLFETPSMRNVALQPSPDATLTTNNIRGLQRNERDCTDYGIYTVRITNLTQVQEGTVDINVTGAQLADYLAGITPAEYPVAGNDPRNPRRIYYPRDDGTAPQKQALLQAMRVVSGPDPPQVNTPSVLEVQVGLLNPTDYAMTNVNITTSLNGDAQYTDPVVSAQPGGLAASVNGRDITITGAVNAQTLDFIAFQTTFTPTATGLRYLTGDGTDLQGGTLPTQGTFDLPFAAGEKLGPICQVLIDADPAVCAATADIQGNLMICAGQTTTLDATTSQVLNCGGVTEYQWWRGASVLYPYPGPDMIMVSPAVSTTYRVEVRCSTETTCKDSTTAFVQVQPALKPPVGNTLRAVRAGTDVMLEWQDSGAASYNLRRFPDKTLDRPGSTLLTSGTMTSWPAMGDVPTPPDRYFYQALAVDCAGAEELRPAGNDDGGSQGPPGRPGKIRSARYEGSFGP